MKKIFPDTPQSLLGFLCLFWLGATAQHRVDITADYDDKSHELSVVQQIVYVNSSQHRLSTVVLNDWNNSYSAKDTPLARRFSDEFTRAFHYAKDEERGHTTIEDISVSGSKAIWTRPGIPDLIEINVGQLDPGDSIRLALRYKIKLPHKRFTGFGYGPDGGFVLRDAFLLPALYRDGFVKYSNENLDDAALAPSDYKILLSLPPDLSIESDLTIGLQSENQQYKTHKLYGRFKNNFTIFASRGVRFHSFRNNLTDVLNGLSDHKTDDIRKAIIVDRVVRFADDFFGSTPPAKIVVSQTDYDRNPFYGLNQLPRFLNTFKDEFVYELKFLKTYLNAYLKDALHLDPRKETWIYDGLQTYAMMQYMDKTHPGARMAGSLGNIRMLQNYNITTLDFNGQYSYFYLLMARKNLDQPVGDPKDTFIKFNEQIASKYRSGLSFKHLDLYLPNSQLETTVKQFVRSNRDQASTEAGFRAILIKNATLDTDWFFDTAIHSREIIDYKITDAKKIGDSVSLTIRNRTGAKVPIPLYGVKNGKTQYSQWLQGFTGDTIVTIPSANLDKVVLNYHNEVPEFNQRNNWRSLRDFHIGHRPFKFVLFKDLEDPYYNQILYIPTLNYNLYDGLTPGLRFYNRTMLDRPFNFDFNPAYSTNTGTLVGSGALSVQHYYRDSNLYNVRYSASANYFHYAPDATYLRLTPMVSLRFRPSDFRDNAKQFLTLRQVIVRRERTNFVISEDSETYSVFNARFGSSKQELATQLNYSVDFQAAERFGKLSGEIQWRKLFEDNRQLTLRLFAGSFLYNSTETDYFSFALDRPTDYLFDYNYYGRSETSGFFSQQFIVAEGGFKSKLDTPMADQWIATGNAGFGIWNWIEAYADAGVVKKSNIAPQFRYDSGIRLNLLQDYFELYLPVYSSNGWEIAQEAYPEKIRFIVTFSPNTLIGLFTRKWF